MNNVLTVYIDCRSDKGDTNDFNTLSMWGKPCCMRYSFRN